MKRKARWVACVWCAVLFVATEPPRIRAKATTVSAPAGAQSSLATNKPRLLEAYGKVPLSFEPNRGQADPRVKFLSRGNGYTVSFTSNEAVLTFRQPSSITDVPLDTAFAPHTTIYYTTNGSTSTSSSTP